jgi:hypothetical protein
MRGCFRFKSGSWLRELRHVRGRCRCHRLECPKASPVCCQRNSPLARGQRAPVARRTSICRHFERLVKEQRFKKPMVIYRSEFAFERFEDVVRNRTRRGIPDYAEQPGCHEALVKGIGSAHCGTDLIIGAAHALEQRAGLAGEDPAPGSSRSHGRAALGRLCRSPLPREGEEVTQLACLSFGKRS